MNSILSMGAWKSEYQSDYDDDQQWLPVFHHHAIDADQRNNYLKIIFSNTLAILQIHPGMIVSYNDPSLGWKAKIYYVDY